jgi:hypothetical protein
MECERKDQEEIVLQRTSERTPEKTPKSRWRQTKPEMYSRIKRKTRMNLDLEYKSDSSRKTVKAREQGPSCLCKNHCRDKLQGFEIEVFTQF